MKKSRWLMLGAVVAGLIGAVVACDTIKVYNSTHGSCDFSTCGELCKAANDNCTGDETAGMCSYKQCADDATEGPATCNAPCNTGGIMDDDGDIFQTCTP